MALLKDFPNRFAKSDIIKDAYIKWMELYIAPSARQIRATFNVYFDQESRDANIPPIDQIFLELIGDSYDQFVAGQGMEAATSIGQLVYGFAKSQSQLEGATDI